MLKLQYVFSQEVESWAIKQISINLNVHKALSNELGAMSKPVVLKKVHRPSNHTSQL